MTALDFPLPLPTAALTLWHPYAAFVAAGAKRIETRSWGVSAANRPETLAIHAAKREPAWTPELRAMAESVGLDARDLQRTRGCIVAVARLVTIETSSTTVARMRGDRSLVQPHPSIDTTGDIGYHVAQYESRLGNFGAGMYCWWLADVVPLVQPILCRGDQKLWAIPETVRRLLAAQVAPSYVPVEELSAP